MGTVYLCSFDCFFLPVWPFLLGKWRRNGRRERAGYSRDCKQGGRSTRNQWGEFSRERHVWCEEHECFRSADPFWHLESKVAH